MIAAVEESWVADVVSRSPVARLGTVDAGGAVRLVPICFVVVDGWVAGAVDHKPKRTGQLRRLDDMESTGHATAHGQANDAALRDEDILGGRAGRLAGQWRRERAPQMGQTALPAPSGCMNVVQPLVRQ